jgi:hypothetical protein
MFFYEDMGETPMLRVLAFAPAAALRIWNRTRIVSRTLCGVTVIGFPWRNTAATSS